MQDCNDGSGLEHEDDKEDERLLVDCIYVATWYHRCIGGRGQERSQALQLAHGATDESFAVEEQGETLDEIRIPLIMHETYVPTCVALTRSAREPRL